MTSNSRKKYDSQICLDGKRRSAMKEIAKSTFGDSFFSIEVYDGKFVIRVDDSIDIERYKWFVDKYKLCRVIIYKAIDFSSINR